MGKSHRHRGTRKSTRKSKKSKKSRKVGGTGGMVAAAVVPAGLFALQRYFNSSRKSKKAVRKFGKSFKRKFRGGNLPSLSPGSF
jgi:hypothetical protein